MSYVTSHEAYISSTENGCARLVVENHKHRLVSSKKPYFYTALK